MTSAWYISVPTQIISRDYALACCAMCGAAAESILLASAIQKIGDEPTVLKEYSTGQGRSRIESKIIGQAREFIKREFSIYTGLLKYWRDEASQGNLINPGFLKD